jgi:hypothetical protein
MNKSGFYKSGEDMHQVPKSRKSGFYTSRELTHRGQECHQEVMDHKQAGAADEHMKHAQQGQEPRAE